MAQINVADENILKLKQIQNVIRNEDGIDSSMDEAPARVLAFRRFVPCARKEARLSYSQMTM